MNKDQIIASKLILQANSQSKEIERLKAEIKELESLGPDWKHLVQSFDDEFVTLNTCEEIDVDMSNPENIDQPSQNTVDDMAKRAMRKRM